MLDEKSVLGRAGAIIREAAPLLSLTDRRIYPLRKIAGMATDWIVWVAFATVEPHTDRTEIGWVTKGLIILNDQELELFLDNPERSFWKFRPGDAYRVLPTVTHGVCTNDHQFNHEIPARYRPELFAAVLRDYRIEDEPAYEDFRYHALTFLDEWNRFVVDIDEVIPQMGS